MLAINLRGASDCGKRQVSESGRDDADVRFGDRVARQVRSMTNGWTITEEHGSTAPAGFLHLVHRTFRMPDGSSTEWDLLGGRNSVAVLALTEDTRHAVIVQQFRPGPLKVLNELPGGYIDGDESPLEAGVRELAEESGYSGTATYVGSTWLASSATVERHVIAVTDAVLIAEPCPDDGEFVAPTLVTVDELRNLLRSGQMTDVDLGYMALDSLGLL